jgi:hypothetical protein
MPNLRSIPISSDPRSTKLSIRLTATEAQQLRARAQADGASMGAVLTGLEAGIPALGSGANRADFLAALIESSAELSTLSRNIHHLAVLLRQGSAQAAREYRAMLEGLTGEVRAHLQMLSATLAELSSAPGFTRLCAAVADLNGADPCSYRLTSSFNGVTRFLSRQHRQNCAAAGAKPRDEPRCRSWARGAGLSCAERRRSWSKLTGGGRGMKAAAHFRYISKNGRLEIEDERGQISRGREAVKELAEDWRFGGTLIEEVSDRREAYNIMLSMLRGVDPLILQRAAREFAADELADHKYVMVLHDHQANPHVHVSVRAESKHGKRLSTQGRLAPLAGDVCGEVARLGDRSGGHSASHTWGRSKLSAALAHQGEGRGERTHLPVGDACQDNRWPAQGAGGVAPDRPNFGRVRRSARSETGSRNCPLRQGRAVASPGTRSGRRGLDSIQAARHGADAMRATELPARMTAFEPAKVRDGEP